MSRLLDATGLQKGAGLGALSVLVTTPLLVRCGAARRLSVALMLFGLRAIPHLAVVLVVRNFAVMLRKHGTRSLRWVLWHALSAWSVAETLFFVYMVQYRRHLESPVVRRWQAVPSHATQDKRKASMERYLRGLRQVWQGGEVSDLDRFKTNSVADLKEGRNCYVSRAGTPKPLQRKESSHSDLSTDVVKDLLKTMDQKKFNESDLQLLKILEIGSWFTGPGRGDPEDPASWLCRGNVDEWVAHYWFRGATPEELRDRRPREYEELQQLRDMVLESMGLPLLPPGYNQHIRPLLFLKDPLRVLHRPLLFYVFTAVVCPFLTVRAMRWLGFKRGRVGGLTYWARPRRGDVQPELDVMPTQQTPLVFMHGLGIGLIPYLLFISRLSRRHSGDVYVPEFPFLAMSPWESIPSSREVVLQIQDMLRANKHTAAHFMGHSFGTIVIGWMMKMSPSLVSCTTFMEPPLFLAMKNDLYVKGFYGEPQTCYQILVNYLAFRELFTVNLLCRNTFIEQSTMWPEELCAPAVVQLAGDDHLVPSLVVRRFLENERATRNQRGQKKRVAGAFPGSSLDLCKDPLLSRSKDNTAPIDIQWCKGFFHGEILFRRGETEKLFARARRVAQG